MTPYEVLDVDPSADDAALRHAYRRLAKRLHPDVRGGDAAYFARLSEAYQEIVTARRLGREGALNPARPRCEPAVIDLGGVTEPRQVVMVRVFNDGGGSPELVLDHASGAGWRVISAAGSTAAGDFVELAIEIRVDEGPARAAVEIHVSMAGSSAPVTLRWSDVRAPQAGTWRGAGNAAAPVAAANLATAPGTLPGWGSILAWPRWRLAATALICGLGVPAWLLSVHASPTGAGWAVVLAAGLVCLAGAVVIRSEGFEPRVLAAAGPGDQAATLAVTGVGSATAVAVVVVVVVALIAAVVVVAILFGVLAGAGRD